MITYYIVWGLAIIWTLVIIVWCWMFYNGYLKRWALRSREGRQAEIGINPAVPLSAQLPIRRIADAVITWEDRRRLQNHRRRRGWNWAEVMVYMRDMGSVLFNGQEMQEWYIEEETETYWKVRVRLEGGEQAWYFYKLMPGQMRSHR